MRGTIVSLCLSHLIGNALLLWLGYYWLGIGESDAAHLLWSALVILILLCSGLWLHGTGLTFFRQNTNVQTAARTALRNLLPLFVLCLAAVIIYGLLMYWRNHFGHSAFVIGSYATMKLRKPVAPSRVLYGFFVFIWLLRWLVAPSLLLPVAASVAVSGWVGFGTPWKRGHQLLYWIEVCALLVCAIWVPLKLIQWVPQISQFNLQVVSFALRLGCAYLLFVGALLALEFVTSSGKPRLSHPRTESSP